jgi:hypothetical protein
VDEKSRIRRVTRSHVWNRPDVRVKALPIERQGSATSLERRLHGLLATSEQRISGEKEISLFSVLFILLIKSKQNWHV